MKEIPLRTLHDEGLLFEINRRVLHPLGMSLALCWDDDARSGEPSQVLLTKTDDMDGVVFSASSFQEGEVKFASFMERVGHARITTRLGVLRFVHQESADQGVDSVYLPR